jgi:hypothetical protein
MLRMLIGLPPLSTSLSRPKVLPVRRPVQPVIDARVGATKQPLRSRQAVGSRVTFSFGVSVSSFSASFRPRQRYRKPAGHRPSSE